MAYKKWSGAVVGALKGKTGRPCRRCDVSTQGGRRQVARLSEVEAHTGLWGLTPGNRSSREGWGTLNVTSDRRKVITDQVLFTW